MDNKEILQKAIKKTKLDRFNFWDLECVKDGTYRVEYVLSHKGLAVIHKEFEENNSHGWDTFVSLESIIFNHDFAKAFWGEERNTLKSGASAIWEYHLSKMVLEKEPLKYLEKFL